MSPASAPTTDEPTLDASPQESLAGSEQLPAVSRPRWWVSQAPPCPPLGRVAVTTLSCLVGLLLLVGIGEVTGHVLLIPAMAGTMALVAAAPHFPLAQPRNVVLGQTIAAALGLAVGAVDHSLWAAAVAASLTVGVTVATRTAHAPAAATAVVGVLTVSGFVSFFVCAVAAAVVITATAVAASRLTRTRYPVYWW